ncbi:MAG: alpha/beta fold hydrolase [Ferruginibacter sp.]|nr:alpha/beta fold hydrolase [Ferruginibacter sp.]
MTKKNSPVLFLIALVYLLMGCVASKGTNDKGPLTIQEQGSFAAGGTVVTAAGTFDAIKHGAFNPANQASGGQTLHGDHAYVFYQVPADARKLPLVFWHGYGQSAKTWETTADGREGFQNIFLRRRFPVYLIDQPRRGRAARSTKPVSIDAAPDEQLWFGIFRMGTGHDFYPGVQFSKSPEALSQFYRHMVPNTGPFDMEVNTNAVSALFNKIGPAILVTHSLTQRRSGLGHRHKKSTCKSNCSLRARQRLCISRRRSS